MTSTIPFGRKVRIAAAALLGAWAFMTGNAAALEAAPDSLPAQKPPEIVLEKCTKVNRAVVHNPMSSLPNDYLLVTTYEESAAGKMETRGHQGGLNVYLVFGFLVPPGNQEERYVHSTGLIVKTRSAGDDPGRETVHQWILIDEDGDRRIDKAFYRETLALGGIETSDQKEVTFPSERQEELQTYFEKAAEALASRSTDAICS